MNLLLKLLPAIVLAIIPHKQPVSRTLSLDKIVAGAVKTYNIPSCAVSIVHGDEILLRKGYGAPETDIHTQFPIPTSLFTAAAFGLLIDKGEITFRDSLSMPSDQIDETFLKKKLLGPLEMRETILPSSTAHDMTNFLFFLIHKGTFHAKTILSPSTFANLITPQTIATSEDPSFFPTAQFLTYGLGCYIHDYRGILMVQVPGASSLLALVPSLQLGIFIAANSDQSFTHSLLFQIIDTFLK